MVMSALVVASWTLSAQPATAPEYNIKAGFLTKFINYTTWPADRFESATSPVVIGVLGTDPFGDILDKTAALSRGGRPLEVRRILTPADAAACHLVFIGKSESRHETEWIAALKQRAVLTVGESGHTIERGGIVEFVSVRNSVGFEASLPAMEQAALKLSSDMLVHARRVYRESKGQR